jgi:hypothetical protein
LNHPRVIGEDLGHGCGWGRRLELRFQVWRSA